MICDTSSSQDAFTHQIWNSFLKEYWRYTPDSMQFLETRSEVKFKVTQLWYATLRHPKMYLHTKFEIPTSNNIRDMLRTTRSEVKVTRKWFATLHNPKMYPHTKFGIPTSKNIGDMHRTRSGTDGRTMHIYYINPFHSGYGKQDLWQTVKTLIKSRIRWYFLRVCTVC